MRFPVRSQQRLLRKAFPALSAQKWLRSGSVNALDVVSQCRWIGEPLFAKRANLRPLLRMDPPMIFHLQSLRKPFAAKRALKPRRIMFPEQSVPRQLGRGRERFEALWVAAAIGFGVGPLLEMDRFLMALQSTSIGENRQTLRAMAKLEGFLAHFAMAPYCIDIPHQFGTAQTDHGSVGGGGGISPSVWGQMGW